ncbi:barstar family protein [Streptomyces sp. SID8352]|uniref:barstar family protein n=1 Tax=Streptomyces sp. SID8352 TaxID=2690338 RepID=UPI00136FBC6D|nr:barstar family protein [Streptomyces sp. SID8352]MYU21840.1 barnase inhibitor [Streptomyces sp. SID8352]
MSKSGSIIPLYHLVEEETGTVIIAAREISGFFVEPDHAQPEEILIYGSPREPVRPGKDLFDVELRVVNSLGKAIGSYYIGRVGLRSTFEGEGSPEQGGFVATFYGHTCPYATAGAIWRRWASGSPLVNGEWARYPVESHDSWLHVVQNSWFETGHAAKRYGVGETCVVDGRRILGESSFYCALGESVNGPGGYFGSTLDGLADCLASSRNAGAPFELVWEHFSGAQERMGASLSASVMDVLREFDVDVKLR